MLSDKEVAVLRVIEKESGFFASALLQACIQHLAAIYGNGTVLLTPVQTQICRTLQEQGPMSTAALSNTLQISYTNIFQHLKGLTTRAYIAAAGHEVGIKTNIKGPAAVTYDLTAFGASALEIDALSRNNPRWRQDQMIQQMTLARLLWPDESAQTLDEMFDVLAEARGTVRARFSDKSIANTAEQLQKQKQQFKEQVEQLLKSL